LALIGKSSVAGIQIGANTSDNRFRTGRFRLFRTLIDRVLAEKQSCSILDVGGTAEYWQAFGGDLPAKVKITVANLHGDLPENTQAMTFARADACAMPYDDNAFDLVHSNSVIEHVGLWDRQRAMANEIRRLAPRYFVQTPNYWFPVEPHCRTLFFHWLPEPMRASLLLRKDRGFWRRAEDIGDATQSLQSAILLDRRQMRYLFPDAEIHRERFMGLVKSMVAIRG